VIASVEIACFYLNVALMDNDNAYQNASPDAQVMKEEPKCYRASPDRILLELKSYSTFTEFVVISRRA